MVNINQLVREALDEHEQTIRILGDIPTVCLDSNDYLTSVRETIAGFISSWDGKADLRLLAVEVWPRHAFFALDFNNHKYDYDTAHTEEIVLPVYMLRKSRRRPRWKMYRYKPQDSQLAKRIAHLHDMHGQEPLPLYDDHNQIVISLNSRSSQKRAMEASLPTP